MLSENIRKFRKLRHLSQVELAESLHVSKQCVSNWENDNILPSVEMLMKLAKFFGISTDALLGSETHNSVCVDGLTVLQVEHVKALVADLREANEGG